MFAYLPRHLGGQPPLVVVLHGCTQTAAGYDHGAGWSTLADRFGFALLMPEQQRSNNPNGCFNWFQSGDIERGHGEALSIREMVESMVVDHGIDRRRVFITGLSAGGAMTSVMLACYPDIFAAGAIIAGLPYGAATNAQQAFAAMFQSPTRPAREWGDLVREASGQHDGPWPRVSVWHGSVDKTVIPSNAREILKQWTNVHGLPTAPSRTDTVDGFPREIWYNEAGDDVIECYTITRMAHGTPLATVDAEEGCGSAGPFLLEVGISSSFHIARYFGLATGHQAASTQAASMMVLPKKPQTKETTDRGRPLDGEILGPQILGPNNGAEAKHPRHPSPAFDVGAVITKALTAAGLMKSP
jgi:feruloyl esterase